VQEIRSRAATVREWRCLALPAVARRSIGDRDLDLSLADPALLRSLLEEPVTGGCRIVLLHAGYPYTRSAGYLAAIEKREVLQIPDDIAIVGVQPELIEPERRGARGVEPDGTLSVMVGIVDIGGALSGLAMMAAEAFGTSPDKVRVEVGDTGIAPFGPLASGSQSTYSVGGAVLEAALEARRQLLEIASAELEVAAEDLEVVDGRVGVRGVPDRSIDITRLVAMSTEMFGHYRPIQATGRSAVGDVSPMFTVHIVRVQIDAETGHFTITGYAAIQDVGRAINPPEIEAQIHGGIAQALGRALGEQLVHDDEGQLRTVSFLDYEIPTVDQMPEVDVRLLEIPSPIGPLGARGVGEPPAIPGAAALVNALAHAAGIRVREVPIDRSRLVTNSAGLNVKALGQQGQSRLPGRRW